MRTICIAAFLSFAIATTALSQLSNEDCVGCHEKLGKTVHTDVGCTDCHADVTSAPHESKPKPVECKTCHEDQVTQWDHGIHAQSPKGARCADCHGVAHKILPSTDPASKTFHKNLPATCSTCHAQKFVMEKAGLSPQMAISYQESIHGRAVARGSTKAAVCTDCHDSHNVRPANDPQSGIFKFNVARTC